MVGDIAEIGVTVLLAYVVYKIAVLIDSLNSRIRAEKAP
jgi:hypothetical protein